MPVAAAAGSIPGRAATKSVGVTKDTPSLVRTGNHQAIVVAPTQQQVRRDQARSDEDRSVGGNQGINEEAAIIVVAFGQPSSCSRFSPPQGSRRALPARWPVTPRTARRSRPAPSRRSIRRPGAESSRSDRPWPLPRCIRKPSRPATRTCSARRYDMSRPQVRSRTRSIYSSVPLVSEWLLRGATDGCTCFKLRTGR